MNKLLKAGYGYLVRTSVVSMCGEHVLSFWGCACPLWWIGPSYDMETIFRRGTFGSKDEAVLSQANTIDELEVMLLQRAKEAWPDPYKLPDARDVRLAWPSLYRELGGYNET